MMATPGTTTTGTTATGTSTGTMTPGTGAAQSTKSPIVIVDIDEMQSVERVKQLRKGKGKLLTKVERIVKDLVTEGTVKSGAQPVVIVVREMPRPFWAMGQDDDDDED
ncbi:MAG: hypothetical protein ACJ8F3_04570 [Xanthobacteraceae bacterium]